MVANLVLQALGARENCTEAEAALLVDSRAARKPNPTYSDKERGYYTSDLAMREALRLLRECLQVGQAPVAGGGAVGGAVPQR